MIKIGANLYSNMETVANMEINYDFVALHSMWIIFLKGICVLERVELSSTRSKTHIPFRKIWK